MKLYYSTGACSLSPHIVLREAGIPFELVAVDLRSKRLQDGSDFRTINPKGYVPALQLDDGQLLTEGPAIVQYIADLKPESKLAPPAGTFERYRLQEWLTFIGTELHKSFGVFFHPNATDEARNEARERLSTRFDFVAKALEGKSYLLGDTFTAADAYLYTILRWTKFAGIDLAKWPSIQAYFERVTARPAVQQALEAEKLKK